MSLKFLPIEDSELENVAGGLIIEEDCNNSVVRVIVSGDEFRYIKVMGCFRGQRLTAEQVQLIESRFSRFGIRARRHVELVPDSLAETKCNVSGARLIVVD